jgi:hypothetical protein
VAVALERSGKRVFEFEHGDRFADHIEALNPDFAKVLVRLNVDGDAAFARVAREPMHNIVA